MGYFNSQAGKPLLFSRFLIKYTMKALSVADECEKGCRVFVVDFKYLVFSCFCFVCSALVGVLFMLFYVKVEFK